jgi:MoxR-like ATPase
VPQDIAELAPDVIRHRLVLSYEALADRVTADEILDRVLERVPQPQRPFTNDSHRYAAPAAEAQAPA